MQTQETRIQERNREIGRVLQEVRSHRNITVTTCAQLIGTSRRRYAAMERGEAVIGIAELEVLMDFLDVPSYKIWHLPNSEGSADRLFVPFTPGRPVQIVFDARKELA
jgi:transcriptional regulator with XRE-family HTH domain